MVTKLNLTIGGGGDVVTREGLAEIETPAPEGRWFPIPHSRLLNLVCDTLGRAGLEIVNEVHLVAHKGARYFGLLQITDGRESDYSFVTGLRNAHDKSIVAGLAAGSGVHCCSNLAFSSEVVIERKHTRFVDRDLPGLVESAVGRLGDLRRTQDDRIALYKERRLTDVRAHDILVQALDARIVPVTRLPDVLKEWREPSHEEFAKQKNAWRLMNAFTEVLKESSLFKRPQATQALHGILDSACGLDVSAN